MILLDIEIDGHVDPALMTIDFNSGEYTSRTTDAWFYPHSADGNARFLVEMSTSACVDLPEYISGIYS